MFYSRSSAEMFHTPYGGGRYESNHQGPVLAGYATYRTDMAPGDYYSMQYVPAYMPDRMISRKPYIPDDSKVCIYFKIVSIYYIRAKASLGNLDFL